MLLLSVVAVTYLIRTTLSLLHVQRVFAQCL
jgi:hypothetical protein